jgi:hypothetical protein
MFPTYSEILEPTKTDPHMGYRWTPNASMGCGLVEIQQKRAVTRYAVSLMPTDWEGVSLRFAKFEAESGTDKTEYAYAVFCGRDGSHQCGCKGRERWEFASTSWRGSRSWRTVGSTWRTSKPRSWLVERKPAPNRSGFSGFDSPAGF